MHGIEIAHLTHGRRLFLNVNTIISIILNVEDASGYDLARELAMCHTSFVGKCYA